MSHAHARGPAALSLPTRWWDPLTVKNRITGPLRMTSTGSFVMAGHDKGAVERGRYLYGWTHQHPSPRPEGVRRPDCGRRRISHDATSRWMEPWITSQRYRCRASSRHSRAREHVACPTSVHGRTSARRRRIRRRRRRRVPGTDGGPLHRFRPGKNSRFVAAHQLLLQGDVICEILGTNRLLQSQALRQTVAMSNDRHYQRTGGQREPGCSGRAPDAAT